MDLWKPENRSAPEPLDVHLDIESAFDNWKRSFKIKYSSIQEELNRRQIIAKRLKIVETNNKNYEQGKSTFLMQLQNYADLTQPEFEQQATGLKLAP